MQAYLLVLVLAHFAIAADDLNAVPYYEYDAVLNGWHAVPSTHPIMVNLRQQYHDVPAKYQDFMNQTLQRKPSGVCQKEVP